MKRSRLQLEETFNTNIEYYKRAAEREKERMCVKGTYHIADIIDAMLAIDNEGIVSIDAMYSVIMLKFNDVQNSRNFGCRILDRFKLNEIKKNFYTYTEEVIWYYMCRLEGDHRVEIKIFPCEPSPECTPVRISEGYTESKWACSQTGKEL